MMNVASFGLAKFQPVDDCEIFVKALALPPFVSPVVYNCSNTIVYSCGFAEGH